jgi:hypothetical protein
VFVRAAPSEPWTIFLGSIEYASHAVGCAFNGIQHRHGLLPAPKLNGEGKHFENRSLDVQGLAAGATPLNAREAAPGPKSLNGFVDVAIQDHHLVPELIRSHCELLDFPHTSFASTRPKLILVAPRCLPYGVALRLRPRADSFDGAASRCLTGERNYTFRALHPYPGDLSGVTAMHLPPVPDAAYVAASGHTRMPNVPAA